MRKSRKRPRGLREAARSLAIKKHKLLTKCGNPKTHQHVHNLKSHSPPQPVLTELQPVIERSVARIHTPSLVVTPTSGEDITQHSIEYHHSDHFQSEPDQQAHQIDVEIQKSQASQLLPETTDLMIGDDVFHVDLDDDCIDAHDHQTMSDYGTQQTNQMTSGHRSIRALSETNSDNYAQSIGRLRIDNRKLNQQQLDQLSLLIKIIRSGDYKEFQEVLQWRELASLLNVFVDGQTPLHYSLLYGRSLVWCKQLVLKGANPNLTNRAGWHPIHIAAFRGSRDTMLFLIDQIDPVQRH